MSKVISPTIGRRVWYFPSLATAAVHDMKVINPDVPLDAGVCFVWHDRMINIVAADHIGRLHAIASVTLIQPDETAPEGRDYRMWMPYQVKQDDKDKAASTYAEPVATVLTTGEPAPGVPTVNSLEQAIREAGADQAARVTMVDIENHIRSEAYFTGEDGVAGWFLTTHYAKNDTFMANEVARAKADASLKLLTICVLVLQNGFTVVGTSAVASPENFNTEIGRRLARERAVDQVWPLLGYELRNQLHRAECLQQAA